MKIGYAHVSTTDQSLTPQTGALSESGYEKLFADAVLNRTVASGFYWKGILNPSVEDGSFDLILLITSNGLKFKPFLVTNKLKVALLTVTDILMAS